MIRFYLAVILSLAGAAAWSAGRPDDIPFQKHTLDLGANEACAIADVNGDGKPDIISGENWFEAPKWIKHKFRTILYSGNYVDDLGDMPLDVDGDGHMDVVTCSWISRRLFWNRNPGRGKGEWKEFDIDTGTSIEFAVLADLDNDGKAHEVLPQFGDSKKPLTWYEAKKGAFVKHVVAPQSYGHGIGAGDVNGDRRTDILTPQGWLEAPADPRAGDWKFHPAYKLESLGFIHVLDVNGDGRNDIVTSYGHNYGVFWMPQDAAGAFGKPVMIDDSWSQPHATTLVDLNGDGRTDIITGKRYMAHNGRDPGEREPLGVYWYESFKNHNGQLEWAKHVIDYSTRTGAGMQVAVADLDGDGDLDFAVGGKSGLYLFENLTRRK